MAEDNVIEILRDRIKGIIFKKYLMLNKHTMKNYCIPVNTWKRTYNDKWTKGQTRAKGTKFLRRIVSKIKKRAFSEIFPRTEKIIFLRHESIFQGLQKILEEQKRFNFVSRAVVTQNVRAKISARLTLCELLRLHFEPKIVILREKYFWKALEKWVLKN